jgi:YidC/Oxa1 family membrane protein insertase
MGTVLRPLELVVAWIMVHFHAGLSALGLPATSGWTWALSIVGLVIVIRIILIPLFVKQIKASRGMQLVQPEIKKIQAKYKGKTDPESRQKMTQETMALYKETGTNPFASCLPIVLQAPIFFALFRVLNGLSGISAGTKEPIGAMTRALAGQAEQSTLFGAQLSSTFLGSTAASVKILTVVLIVLMSASTFTTQRQLMMKNMPASALDNPFAQQQKILLYVLPLVFAVSGVNFPIGVLLYWLTTNVWSMGQQFYVIRRMPAPGSPAEKAMQERKAKRGNLLHKPGTTPQLNGSNGVVVNGTSGEPGAPGTEAKPITNQRVQPKKQPKSKRSGAKTGAKPADNKPM